MALLQLLVDEFNRIISHYPLSFVPVGLDDYVKTTTKGGKMIVCSDDNDNDNDDDNDDE